jgi:thiamine kinase-like enzyme
MERMTPEEAAITVATRFGLTVKHVVRLGDSNNIVLWLRPAPVVAKVGLGHHSRLALELAVAKHLARMQAPAIGPAVGLPQRVFQVEDLELTFWAHQPHRGRKPTPRAVAASLFELHGALLSYRGRLPSYMDELAAVAEVLNDASRVAALADLDRQLLIRTLDRFRAELGGRAVTNRPLHGSPHGENMVVTDRIVRFLDFETACLGPLEWDLAHVDDEVILHYPGTIDVVVLRLCRALVSVKTAAWCWARFDHPALRWHARHHLDVVRTLA